MKLNPILNLHPLTKLYFALFVTISVIIIPSYIFAFTWFPVLLVIAIIAGVGKQYLDIVVKALVLLLGIVFLMQLFFYPGDQVIGEWWIFEVTKEGLQYGLVLTSRVLAMGSAFILFFRITEIRDFVKALEDLGMPPMGAYIVLSTLQIIPEMRRQAHTIMEAQKTRGVETEGSLLIRAKAFIPILTPLILSSIASTEERAITLESRAFSAPTKKTSLHKLKKSSSDRTIPIVLLILMISLIIWRLFL
ncbi:energy-coupling factor transporter transmembrane component T [Viridibacillus arvi]|uniref:energy-coupling factor transporter transmembrane component T n=1 Tax=Viridibacillus arvi TaxID=263475 RepID=UPI00187B919F|nr:energy-coupling factor transporter transmembrane component T [Viridibacillus sp. JNUCC-6]QOV10197.1 energy-coupling factor transporter transmembrane protein EcfT [Viridibacillus sp. JNUCC-6]